MSTSYAEKLKDPRWQKKRLVVMERQETEDKARMALGRMMASTPDIAGFVKSIEDISAEVPPVLFLFSDNTVLPLMADRHA